MADGLPSLPQVAALVSTRTKGRFVDLGTFTDPSAPGVDDGTLPTATQVNNLIERSARQVYARLGSYRNIPEPKPGNNDLRAAAVDLVALRTSLWVELSFFPEQVKGDTSPFAMLLDAFKDELAALTEAVQEAIQDGDDAQAGVSIGTQFAFAETARFVGPDDDYTANCDTARWNGDSGWR